MTLFETEYGLFLLLPLAICSLASTVMAAMSILNAVRLRNERMSWTAGKLWGYPLTASLLLVFSLALLSVSYLKGGSLEILMAVLFFWTAGAWFISRYLGSKRYITDNGIVIHINDPSRTVAWHQFRDFSVCENWCGTRYTFLYTCEPSGKPRVHRIDLQVPSRYKDAFGRLVAHKLGRQINCSFAEPIDIGKLNFE